jgi:hypothetical protein
VKLFFRLSQKIAKERRFTRQGYGSESNPDEFWKTEEYLRRWFGDLIWSSMLSYLREEMWMEVLMRWHVKGRELRYNLD